MDDCVFCKIIHGDIPSVKVFENDDVLAFLDLSQVTPGHTLLIPKKHVQDIFAYDDDLAQHVLTYVPKIARGIRKAFPDSVGMNICNNNGKDAYQSVFHSHIHFVPRYGQDDDFKMTWTNNADKYSHEQLEAIGAKIKAQFGGQANG